MIRGIIFDCFGVLCHGSLDYLRSITPAEHLEELNDLSHRSDYGYISRSDYTLNVGRLIGRSPEEVDEQTRRKRILNDDVIKFVRSLHDTYKIGLLSNVGRGVIDELFSSRELDELFNVVILSSEVGMVKPHREIYELTAHRLGLSPRECIMVDDLFINVIGAEKVGMHGILYSNIEQLENDVYELQKVSNA